MDYSNDLSVIEMEVNSSKALPEENIAVGKNVRPPTPVAATKSKTIKETVAGSPTMNYLLQRFEMGESLDLSKQLEILENDSYFSSHGNNEFGSCTTNANQTQENRISITEMHSD